MQKLNINLRKEDIMETTVKIKKLSPNAIIPTYGTYSPESFFKKTTKREKKRNK